MSNVLPNSIFGNSLYTLLAPVGDFDARERAAAALGGYQVSINTQSEQDFIFTKYGNSTEEIYLGTTDRVSEGIWRNSDGTRADFTYWQPGEPNNWNNEDYAVMITRPQFNPWEPGWSRGKWLDAGNGSWTNFEITNDGKYKTIALAEIPLSLSITRTGIVKEGAGVFTTSINLSAGTQASGNLAEGATVYWNVSGITADDLASGTLTGSGTITNGKLDIQHSLKVDTDTGEQFSVSVYSDSAMTQQIGATNSVGVQESTSSSPTSTTPVGSTPTNAIIRGTSAYVIVDGPTWTQAQANAVKLGGNLVTINDKEENDFLTKNIDWRVPLDPKKGAYAFDRSIAYWTGLNDRNQEGRLEWVDGTQVSYLKNGPSDARGDEDYFTLINTGAWNDITQTDPNWQMQYGIAEIKLAQTDLPIIFGFSSNDKLIGTDSADFIDGRKGQDILTGNTGADIFSFRFGDSPVSGADQITDFKFGEDRISILSASSNKLNAPTALSRAANNSSATTLGDLVASVFKDANGATSGNQSLGVNQASIVVSTNKGIAGTYLIINNNISSFQSDSDLLINITGYSGSLPGLGNITPSSIFA